MARLLATAKMPKGVLNRYYRTRMMTAEGATFDEPSPRWAGFYRRYGWATDAVGQSEPAAPPPRRGRAPKTAAPAPEPEPEPAPEPQAAEHDEPDLEDLTNSELRGLAELRGLELPSGYVTNGELIAMLKGG